MFKLNKKIKYALIAVKHMVSKKKGELTTAKEICDTYGIPFDTTARSLQLLAQNGILQASQGVHGGYQLLKNLCQVSLQDLNDIILGPITIADCLSRDVSDCQFIDNCIVITPLIRLNERIHHFLSHISIASLINGENHPTENEIRKKAALSHGNEKTCLS